MADESTYLGARLQVTTSEGKYEGTVHSIDTQKRKLTLNKVELLEEGNKNDQESKSKTIENDKDKGISEPKPGSNSREASKPPPSRSTQHQSSAAFGRVKSRGVVKAFRDAGIGFNTTRLAVSSGSMSRDVSDEGHSLLKRDPIVAEKYLSDMLSDDDGKENLSPDDMPDVVPIDAFGKTFEDAVKFISKQRVIGVCCEGVNLGRYGKLCWLIIGCSKIIYLFDVHTLGAPCFDEGLQDILESGDILKVFHDCRQVSDALHHHYNIALMNVFDTQVADVIIYKNERGGELPRHVNGLVACLYEYLNLSPEHVHFQKVRQKYMQKNDAIWAERPAPSSLVDVAAKHVMYLRELRLAQMERLMAEFLYGVDIYLGVTRDAKDINPKVKGQLLPDRFKELGQFRFRHRTRRYDGDFFENTKDGVPEDVLASREAWSEGHHFAEKYEKKKGRVKERRFEPPTGYPPTPVDKLRQAARDSGSDSESSNLSAASNGLGAEAAGQRQSVPTTLKTSPVSIPPSHLQTIFTENDFPPLSSSDSEGLGTPPRLSSLSNNSKNQFEGARNEGRIMNGDAQVMPRATGSGYASSSPEVQSTFSQRPHGVSKESALLPARGRAQALLRHAGLPALRLPTEETAVDYRQYEHNASDWYDDRGNGHQFPSDDALYAAPEVISAPRHQIVGGTQVRIRKT